MPESQYAPGASHLLDDSEPDSPLSSAYANSPVISSSSRPSYHGRHSSRSGRDSDASASGASSFGPERTSGSSSPIASTSHSHHHPSNVNPVTGKRKRSRVTPVQLAHLERVFAKDRSPTAAKRKELAEVLGMNERQTQVWFQNRRAKAKLLEQRARAGRPPVARGENSGSSSGASYGTGGSGGMNGDGDADALSRIHEDESKLTHNLPLISSFLHYLTPPCTCPLSACSCVYHSMQRPLYRDVSAGICWIKRPDRLHLRQQAFPGVVCLLRGYGIQDGDSVR